MKLSTWGHAALAAVLCAALSNAAEPLVGPMDSGVGPGSLASEIQDGGLDYCSCNNGYCDGNSFGAGLMNRPIQIVAGAQYIYARANFSEALAFVNQDSVSGTTTFNCFDFNYNSSYNFYGGFYLCDCGGAVLFNFTRLTSDADTSADETSTNQVFGPYEANDNIVGHADADVKSYDLSFAKTIPLGCPLQCGKCGSDSCCGDSCCGDSCSGNACGGGCGCGGGWCPAWDIVWSGGVRFADAGWSRTVNQIDPTQGGAFLDGATTRMDFDGFGGRVGLLGRRYIGKRGLVSLYAKGDWSLLLGDVNITTTVTNQAGQAFYVNDCTKLIPVTEIELGGTVHLGRYASASAGYFWAAWHDLGMSDQYDFNQFQVSHYDDANIMGWDGLFARVQVMF